MLLRRLLVLVTAWHLADSALGVATGAIAASPAVVVFGVCSFAPLLGSLVVLRRLSPARLRAPEAEETAERLVGLSFYIVAALATAGGLTVMRLGGCIESAATRGEGYQTVLYGLAIAIAAFALRAGYRLRHHEPVPALSPGSQWRGRRSRRLVYRRPMADATPTLYDWAGGREPIGRMLNAFYDRVEGDELLAPVFDGAVSAAHREAVTAWWGEVFGGPAGYTAHHGGYENMLARHRGLGITSEQRRRFVELLSLAADDAGLPDDPEFRSALLAYAEWGTRLAMHNSAPGAEVAPHAPVPRWGWGEAPPYEP